MNAENAIDRLAQRHARGWPAILACRAAAKARQRQVADLLDASSLVPSDCEFVAFGSLARLETTQGSDLDWTLLVDGPADPHHRTAAHEIVRALREAGIKAPGSTGTFGDLSFSHDLIHQIGGQADTNLNTTRRVLLLLESIALGPGARGSEQGVRNRVLSQLFRRYLDEDRGYHKLHEFKIRVPRLLLNDVVRYWRTMAVDYAAKRRDRGGSGWAIRNFKLRLSRKLMFAAGLALCLSCELTPSTRLLDLAKAHAPENEFYQELGEFLREMIDRAPLELLAQFGEAMGGEQATCELLDRYDEFLAILDDSSKRATLDGLDFEAAASDATYLETRKIGSGFQEALTNLFFASNENLAKCTQRYGVF